MDDEPLRCQRDAFAIPDGVVWLNSAYMGPLPRAVAEAGAAGLAARTFPVGLHAEDFFAPAEAARAACARLVGADPERVALVPTVADGMAAIARNLAPRAGQNVVLLGEQFPSNVYPWRGWAAGGVELRHVPAPDAPWVATGGAPSRATRWNDAIVAALDERPALVTVEQAHWTDGTLFDLGRIGERARAVGAAYVVDATQTAGAMPIDVGRLRPDALVVHAYKSMLCSYGLGFMALGERFLDGTPVVESWLTRAGSEDFARLVDYVDGYAPGARRFDTSLRANPVLIRMLATAAGLLEGWGPARIRAYLLGIERPFVERVRALGLEVADEHERAANIFGLRLPDGLAPETVRRALAERDVHVSVRGSAVRVSPHVLNDEADLARLADVLETVMAG